MILVPFFTLSTSLGFTKNLMSFPFQASVFSGLVCEIQNIGIDAFQKAAFQNVLSANKDFKWWLQLPLFFVWTPAVYLNQELRFVSVNSYIQ